jgi:hypothetical protein
MGATMAPMTAAVMNSVGRERAGLGSAMTNTSREVGGVLGIALLGAILSSQISSAFKPALERIGLSSQQAAGLAEGAKQGGLNLAGLSPEQAVSVKSAFDDAFMQGFRPALLFAGAVLLTAAFVANRFIPGRDTIAEHHASADAGEPVPAAH